MIYYIYIVTLFLGFLVCILAFHTHGCFMYTQFIHSIACHTMLYLIVTLFKVPMHISEAAPAFQKWSGHWAANKRSLVHVHGGASSSIVWLINST